LSTRTATGEPLEKEGGRERAFITLARALYLKDYGITTPKSKGSKPCSTETYLRAPFAITRDKRGSTIIETETFMRALGRTTLNMAAGCSS
jgi:hypothetical protein